MRDEIKKLRDDLLQEAAKLSGAPVNDILGKERYTQCVRARYAMMFVLVEYFGLTLVETGHYFGRDHSTVVHARMIVAAAMTSPKTRQRDSALSLLVEALVAMIPGDLQDRNLRLYQPSIPERLTMLENELREQRAIVDRLTKCIQI